MGTFTVPSMKHKGKSIKACSYVMDSEGVPLVRRKHCQEMGVIQRIHNAAQDIAEELYPQLEKTIGIFTRTYSLKTD